MSQAGRTDRHRGLQYMPALDGLRALSVIAVLLYHADISWMPGGFLGVEAFFTISGFLITSLLLKELDATETVSLRDFWLRRARRLLPAVIILLAAIVAFTAIFLPSELADARRDAAAAMAYITNWALIFQNVSYFEAFGRPSFMQHLWSLAIEEQFYLLWPLITLFGVRFFGRRGLLIGVLIGIVGSTALMWSLYEPIEDPSRIYYGTDTRAAGLLVGAALALIWPHAESLMQRLYRSKRRLGKNLLGLVALALLLYWPVRFSEFDDRLYQGGFLIVSVTTAAVIAGTVGKPTVAGRFLSTPFLRWIGTRSYGIYLWHWPVFQLTRPGIDVQLDGIRLLSLRIAITLVLAELSYKWIELPVRRYGLKEAARRAFRFPNPARLGLATSAAVIFLALVGATTVSVSGSDSGSESASATGEVAPSEAIADVASTSEPRTPAVGRASSVKAPNQAPTETKSTPEPEREATAEEEPEATAEPDDNQEPTAEAPPPADETPAPSVTAIGDSVMIGAQEEITERLGDRVDIHAEVAFSFQDGIQRAQELGAAGQLGQVAFVHLGTNGAINDDLFDQMMVALEPTDRVVFMTVRVPRRWEGVVNDVVRRGVERYPEASLADWKELTDANNDLFVEDQVHLRFSGQELYADVVLESVG